MSDNIASKTGYNEEDHYVALQEAEKIAQLRKERQEQKLKAEKELHWMKCPKCGSDMEEIELEGIMIDKCKSCNGIYFDDGELKLLLNRQGSTSFFGKLKGLWS